MATRKEQTKSQLLILRYRQGDDTALSELVALWERRLFYYIRRLVPSEEDAWDLLQEAWCRVIRKLPSLREPEAFAAWLYTTARRTASNHLRDNALARELREPNPDADPVDDSTATPLPAFDAEQLHAALGRLTLPHREALTLHFLEGFSLAEIAGIVDVPLGTVKSRLHHAKQALRQILEQEEQNHE